jgi:hypothetical protein
VETLQLPALRSFLSGEHPANELSLSSLNLAVSQSVSLGADVYYSLTVTVVFLWGALSDERMGLSFVYAAGPRQRSLSRVPSPLGLVTIFYCLIFETSLFVSSYDSQGHGAGIRLRLPAGFGYSLYRHGEDPTDNIVSQFLYCCFGRLPSESPDIFDVFTGSYQATHVPSRDRCIATVLYAI